MAEKKMFVTETGSLFYRTRMLQPGDPITLTGPQARLQTALGNVSAKRPPRVKPQLDHDGGKADDMKALRAAYRKKFGKGPGPSWDAATLREKIAAA